MKNDYRSLLLKLNLLLVITLFFNALLLSFNSTANAEAVNLKEIQKIEYKPSLSELFIENPSQFPFAITKAQHNAKRKEIVFFVPQSIVQPTPKTIAVQNDPIIKSIELEQRALEGVPAVRVKLNLYTNSPYMPFGINSDTSGIKLKFSSSHQEAKNQQGSSSDYIDQQKSSLTLKGQNAKDGSMSLTINPDTPGNISFKAIDSNNSQSSLKLVDSVVGPVSSETSSIITDILCEENNVTVVSQNYPLTVKRSFVLKEPNRYVMDLSPAVLSSRTLIDRAIPVFATGVFNIKAGQFDENTVRIVVQFTNDIPPVDISQWSSNRVLKLSFK